jgi:hypothetical protein
MAQNAKMMDYEKMDYLLEDVISNYLIEEGKDLIKSIIDTAKACDEEEYISINLKSHINEVLNITFRDYINEVPARYKNIDKSEIFDEFYLSMKYEFSSFVKQYFRKMDIKVDISNPKKVKLDANLLRKINNTEPKSLKVFNDSESLKSFA